MAVLLCTENLRGEESVLCDKRMCAKDVFDNMLKLESRHTPTVNPFASMQMHVKPENRQICCNWMLELTEEYKFENTVFPFAVSLMNRFLCLGSVSRAQFQLTACASLGIASKMRSVHGFPIGTFEHHSDYTISSKQLVKWETLMAFKLGWDFETVTANEFVDHILNRVHDIQRLEQYQLVSSHAHVLAHLAITDTRSITMKPSLIAAAAIVGALRGLRMPSVASREICDLTGAKMSDVEELVKMNEKLLENYNNAAHYSLQCFTP